MDDCNWKPTDYCDFPSNTCCRSDIGPCWHLYLADITCQPKPISAGAQFGAPI